MVGGRGGGRSGPETIKDTPMRRGAGWGVQVAIVGSRFLSSCSFFRFLLRFFVLVFVRYLLTGGKKEGEGTKVAPPSDNLIQEKRRKVWWGREKGKAQQSQSHFPFPSSFFFPLPFCHLPLIHHQPTSLSHTYPHEHKKQRSLKHPPSTPPP